MRDFVVYCFVYCEFRSSLSVCHHFVPFAPFKMDKEEQLCHDDNFYTKAEQYWSQVPPTVDGMLGGFGMISQTDISGSEKFLKIIFKWPDPPGKQFALDCGAGIGRITKNLLQNHFERVDLVEQNPKFLEEAKNKLHNCKKIGSFYPVGLQNFVPENEKYDIIWCQWVLGHLTDEDFVKFFISCKKGLRNNGVIVVKENVSGGEVEKDEQDSSVTRPFMVLKELLHQAGLKIHLNHRQRKFPAGLYEVRMLALKPSSYSSIKRSDVVDTKDLYDLPSCDIPEDR